MGAQIACVSAKKFKCHNFDEREQQQITEFREKILSTNSSNTKTLNLDKFSEVIFNIFPIRPVQWLNSVYSSKDI